MFNLFKRPSDTLIVDQGRVCCPVRRADIDIERCAGCRWLLAYEPEARPPHLQCRPERPPLTVV